MYILYFYYEQALTAQESCIKLYRNSVLLRGTSEGAKLGVKLCRFGHFRVARSLGRSLSKAGLHPCSAM
jgi:hypothetical protein